MGKYIGPALLVIFVVIGATNYDSYGVAWDEPAQRAIGYISAEYILGINDRLLTYADRDYGPAFELLLVALEKAFDCSGYPNAYLLRHLITHLFFLTGAFFCYLLVDLLYKNKTLAAIAFLLVVLNPRLYAHSFFNSKDIPFASLFFICFYFCAIAFTKRKHLNFILLGGAVGILINLRIIGVGMMGVVLLLFFIDCIHIKDIKRLSQNIYLFATFTITALFTLYCSWPFLWTNPISNFLYVINSMSMFRWNGDVLFQGEIIKAADLPWYYIPKWFLMSVPLLYIVLGFLAILMVCYNLFKKGAQHFISSPIEHNTVIYTLCFILPVLAVVGLGSIVYDDWRHLYFIYSPFVLIMIYAIDGLMKTNARTAALPLLITTFLSVALIMIRQNPYQHIYFNVLLDRNTPEYLKSQYELDYWGLSYKEALEYILSRDSSPVIKVAVQNPAGQWNSFILKTNDCRRFKYVSDLSNAEYFISNDRTFAYTLETSEWTKIYSIKNSSNTINTVYSRKVR